MGRDDPLISNLKKMGGWDFFALDVFGFSSGVITRFNDSLTLFYCFYVCSRLYTVIHSKSLDNTFSLTLLNLYEPYEG